VAARAVAAAGRRGSTGGNRGKQLLRDNRWPTEAEKEEAAEEEDGEEEVVEEVTPLEAEEAGLAAAERAG
jgi:hypothetical protein